LIFDVEIPQNEEEELNDHHRCRGEVHGGNDENKDHIAAWRLIFVITGSGAFWAIVLE
jgi:hypothetical protein